jgi:hypothetical protein
MGLAFIFFSAIKTKKQISRVIIILAIVGIILSVYGFGQKYAGWPVYSTMNREFSKGWRLVLTEFARVPSTFAGHYDFAAYLVMVLNIYIALLLGPGLSKKIKFTLFTAFIFCYASLLLTASRTSFIAYLVSVSLVCAFFIFRKGIIWVVSRWMVIMAFSLISMLFFGDLSSRFSHVLRIEQFKQYVALEIDKRFPDISNQSVKSIPLSSDLSLVYTDTDTPPVPVGELPPDVFEAIPETFPEATLSAKTEAEKERIATLAGKPRTYSPTAFTFGLSSAIRLDALWPRAIAGFKKNPLLGSGYSTLVKVQNTEFTEAESTDNDYLRALGETGILGFLSFYGIFIYALVKIWRFKNSYKYLYLYSVMIGIGGAMVGLLVNGLYIDVFEASKVAYIFWAMMGVLFTVISLLSKKSKFKIYTNETE